MTSYRRIITNDFESERERHLVVVSAHEMNEGRWELTGESFYGNSVPALPDWFWVTSFHRPGQAPWRKPGMVREAARRGRGIS